MKVNQPSHWIDDELIVSKKRKKKGGITGRATKIDQLCGITSPTLQLGAGERVRAGCDSYSVEYVANTTSNGTSTIKVHLVNQCWYVAIADFQLESLRLRSLV